MDNDVKELFQQLFNSTEEIAKHIDEINLDMEKNEPERVENLLHLIENREEIITQLKDVDFNQVMWDEYEMNKIGQLKQWELMFEPKLKELYSSFKGQLDKLQLGKKTAQYYGDSFDPFVDGVFFDKRK